MDKAAGVAHFLSEVDQIAPLITTLRDGEDWDAALTQVSDQIIAMTEDDAKTFLLVALMAVVSLSATD